MANQSLILALKCDLRPFRKALGEAKGAATIAGTDILKATTVTPDVKGIQKAQAKLKELKEEAKLARDVLSEALQGKGGGIDTSSVQKDIDKLSIKIKKLSSDTAIAKAEMNASLNGMIDGWGKVSRAIGVGLAALGMAAFASAKKLGDEAEAMDNLAAKTGMPVKALAELGFVASQSGLDINAIGNGVGALERKLFSMDEGGGAAADALAQLGVKTKDVNGQFLPMGKIFEETVDALRNVENATTRNTTAAQIFGKGFGELTPILAMGRNEYNALVESGYKAGAVLTGTALEQARGVDNLMDKLNAYARGLQITLATAIVPAMESIAPLIVGLVNGLSVLVGGIGRVFSGKSPFVTFLASFIVAAPVTIVWALKLVAAFNAIRTAIATAGGIAAALSGNWGALAAGLAAAVGIGAGMVYLTKQSEKGLASGMKSAESFGTNRGSGGALAALNAIPSSSLPAVSSMINSPQSTVMQSPPELAVIRDAVLVVRDLVNRIVWNQNRMMGVGA